MKKKRTIYESAIIENALDVIFGQSDAASAIHTVLGMLGEHFSAGRAYILRTASIIWAARTPMNGVLRRLLHRKIILNM